MDSSPRTLYLIDGYASIFRAFYAIRNPIHSPVTGEPTQAILVFTQMLFKLYATLKPDYIVMAMDAPGETFREEVYADYVSAASGSLPGTVEPAEAPSSPVVVPVEEEAPSVTLTPPPVEPRYKGNRRETPDALFQQTERILQLLGLCGIPVIGKPGLEADDVIATITDRLMADPAHADLRIRIVSRDKDLEQLLSDRVTLFDVHTGTETDVAALRAKRGIEPEQVVDLLTLTGDAVDNIPGVDGIGPRTAAKLLQQYGTLDAILENLDQLKGAWRDNLAKVRPALPYSRRLVTLKRDEEIPFSLEDSRVRPLPTEAIVPLFDELGFNRLKDQIPRSVLEENDAEKGA
jgi:DNA polymerase-1